MNVTLTVRILFKVLKIFDVFGAFQGLDMMLPKNCLHVKLCASQTYRYIVLETRIITVVLLIIQTIYSSETRIITVIFLLILTSLSQLIWHVSVSWGCS